MSEFLRKLFASDLMPHGYCYLWKPEILWLNAIADGTIALSYYLIPVALFYFVRKRRDLPFHWMFLMFGVFILGCGSTHLMEIWTLWHGTYRLAGVVKAVTAVASLVTAAVLIPLVPRALALPRPEELRAANRKLEEEIQERRRIEKELAETNLGLQAEINERRLLADQLRQSQKMEAIGRLAGGVAHDFNNLLMVITGHTTRLLALLEEDTAARRAAERIDNAGGQAIALTRQLLAFSRKQVLQPRVIDLNTTVTEMNQTILPLLGELIEMVTEVGREPAYVRADPGQIQQVILNLAINARDAMPHGGRLKMTTTRVSLDKTAAEQQGLSAPGDYIRLDVTDNGVGMGPETLSHLFEPFFTTKPTGFGTGLGLSTAYGIVRQSEGIISVGSEVGRGTTFSIYLPSVEGALESLPREQESTARAGAETILLVEDAAVVRELVREMLSDRGYKVLEAGDGEEALALSDGFDEPIHLVLTDLWMPRISGRDLAGRLRAKRNGLKTIYMSAYALEHLAGAFDAEMNFLQKPFSPDALQAMIRRLLDGDAHF